MRGNNDDDVAAFWPILFLILAIIGIGVWNEIKLQHQERLDARASYGVAHAAPEGSSRDGE